MNFVPCSYTDIRLFHSLWHMKVSIQLVITRWLRM